MRCVVPLGGVGRSFLDDRAVDNLQGQLLPQCCVFSPGRSVKDNQQCRMLKGKTEHIPISSWVHCCVALQTGVKVTNVNDLQDIDELCVVEVRSIPMLQHQHNITHGCCSVMSSIHMYAVHTTLHARMPLMTPYMLWSSPHHATFSLL